MDFRRIMPRTVVYFPIEITSREYAGHVVLGAHLASMGMRVVIGHREIVNSLVAKADKPGIVFFKGDAELRAINPQYAKLPHRFVGQDPEAGIVLPTFEEFYNARSIMQNLETSSAYFCYGPADYRYLKIAHPKAPLHQHGSPRVWLWGEHGNSFYSEQINLIEKRYGAYILMVDSWAGTLEIVPVAAQLSRATGCKVVIRPHPAANAGEYARRARTVSGVSVETAFELNPWIRASVVTLAVGSTASFEAWFADKPVLSDDRMLGDAFARTREALVADRISLAPNNFETLSEIVNAAPARWDTHRARDDLNDVVKNKLTLPQDVSIPAIAAVISTLVDSGFATSTPRRFDVRRERFRLAQSSMWISDETRFKFRPRQPRKQIKRSRVTLQRARSDVLWVVAHFGLPRLSVKQIGPNCVQIE